jgi:hypothetical protein
VARKCNFGDYVKIRNVREGKWVDGKLKSVYFDLVVGPFSFPHASWLPATGSLRLNAGGRKGAKIKGSYVATVVGMLQEVIVEMREKSLDKEPESGYSGNRG